MYWIRTGTVIDLLLFMLLCLMWSLGGWLLATHIFHLRSSERLLAGFTTGLLLFIALSNLLYALLAPILSLPAAYWTAGILILISGLGLAWGNRHKNQARPWLDFGDWRAWPQIVALGALTFIFVIIGRGLALFDDYLHLPLVSVMAAGDLPPHFYLNPGQHFAYHYGLQVLAAGMVRLGGFFPWSAWDFSKAFAIALTLVLGWVWFRRVTGSQRAATLGSLLIGFGSGARWLLLLIPLSLLIRISGSIHLANTGLDAGPNLLAALSHAWPAEGAGPYPFPFAFYNGIFVPVIFTLGASGAMHFMTVILLLLLGQARRFSLPAILVLSLIFATLALSAEHIFVFLWAGIALAGLIYLVRQRLKHKTLPRGLLLQWAAFLILSGLLSVVQGAFITEAVRNVLLSLQGVASTTGGSYDYFSFTPRWPPALVSAHLGELSLLDPSQLIVLLAELGPGLILAPLATVYAWRRIDRRNWMAAGLGIAALLSIFIAVFFSYGVERSSTRLPAAALWIWVLLGFPVAWQIFKKSRPFTRFLFQLGYVVTIFSGLVIFAVQLTSSAAPQISYYINANDAQLSNQLWNQLPPDAQILDRVPERSVALFGRASRSSLDFYHQFPEWKALIKNPDPAAVARAGYRFIYMDPGWWSEDRLYKMTPEQRQALEQPCVKKFAKVTPADGDFRWLLDVSACK